MRKSAPGPSGGGPRAVAPGKAARPRRPLCGRARGERGAAGLLVALFLPALVVSFLGVVALGEMILARHLVSCAADLGALAGIQALDTELLAQGRLVLIPGEARKRAREYALANLGSMFPGLESKAQVDVTVIDTEDGGIADPVSGKIHSWPTVCVLISLELPVAVGPLRVRVCVRAHADASAVPR